MSGHTDQELVERLKQCDSAAFDELFERYRARLYGFLVRLSGRRDVAEDLLQETWIRLATRVSSLREDSRLAPWLFAVARNLYCSYRRSILLAAKGLLEFSRMRADNLPYSRYAEGIKIASVIRPNPWLSITPSFVYLTKAQGLEYADIPQMSLGLDVALVSSVEGWSLTTGIQYPIRDRASAAFSHSPDDDGLDLSLNYRQWLTEKMQLSVTGENLFSLSPRVQGSSYRDEREEGRFSLMLNFFY